MTKVAVIGVGRVGAALAYHLCVDPICGEVVLVDIDQAKARAEADDLRCVPGRADRPVQVRDGSYYDCADADICVLSVCTHFPPNTPQLEMIDHAATMLGRIVPSVMATGFQGIFLVVTDPVDLMTWLAQQLSDLPDTRVLGIGTALDTARLRTALAERLGTDAARVDAWVLGRHGEDPVIPWGQITVDGHPLDALLSPDAGLDRDALCNTIAERAYQLAAAKGAPVFSIAAAVAAVLRQLLTGEGRPVPVSAMLHGAYGQRDVYLGVPAILGPEGVREIVELPLAPPEQAKLDGIADQLRRYMIDIV